MADSPLNYEKMVQDAMRSVARSALQEIAAHGLPGDHHFYIGFRTGVPEVEMPAHLRAQYPDEMTIILQHQYWDLLVDDVGFSVGLAFGGKREQLFVPFAALTSFVDPSVEFGIQFTRPEAAGEPLDSESGAAPPEAAPGAEPEAGKNQSAGPGDEGESGDKVIPLDRFRKK